MYEVGLEPEALEMKLLQPHAALHHVQNPLQSVVGQPRVQHFQAPEECVVLERRNDRHEVSGMVQEFNKSFFTSKFSNLLWLEVIEVSQVKNAVVVRQVDGVDVPRHFFPVRNAVEVAHAPILSAEAAAWSDISRIRRTQLIGENRDALAGMNFDLPDDVLEWYGREDLLDGRRQVGEDDVGVGAEVARVADRRERICFIGRRDGEMCWLLALNREDVEIMEAAIDSRRHFRCQQVDTNGSEHEHAILGLIALRLEFDHVLHEYLRVTSQHGFDAVCKAKETFALGVSVEIFLSSSSTYNIRTLSKNNL